MPFLLTKSRRASFLQKCTVHIAQWQCICQGEIVKFSDYQKTELGKEVEVKSTSTRSPLPPNHHLHQITSPHPPPWNCLIAGGLNISWLSASSCLRSSLVWSRGWQPAPPEPALSGSQPWARPGAQRGRLSCLPDPWTSRARWSRSTSSSSCQRLSSWTEQQIQQFQPWASDMRFSETHCLWFLNFKKSVGVNLSLWNFLSGQVRRMLDT